MRIESMLMSPFVLGSIAMRNRIVMAPMTRDRAGPGDVPTEMMVEYYSQRASAGLIVTEGVQPSAVGKGYWRTPGIHSPDQVDGWRKVSDAVHQRGGAIVMQLMHCGRVIVPDNRGFEADILAPSAIACPALVPGPDGVPVPTAMPRAATRVDIDLLVEEFAQAARNAVAAGMDGVELHCASGYLIHQFLNPASNTRDDEFGGSIENRMRFPLAVLRALAEAIGGDRVGFRIAPGNPYNGMDIADVEETYVPFVKAADALGLAYVHVIDMHLPQIDTLAMIRANWSGAIMANDSQKVDGARALVETGRADVVSFGRAFIANPDLVERIEAGAPLARVDFAHVYVGEEKGYTDYPAMEVLTAGQT